MDIVFSSATQLAAAIQAGRVTATDVLEAHLAQIERSNPALNAVVTLDAERARERAREADAALARGEVWGPLHGVPFTLKDAHATAGMRTTTRRSCCHTRWIAPACPSGYSWSENAGVNRACWRLRRPSRT